MSSGTITENCVYLASKAAPINQFWTKLKSFSKKGSVSFSVFKTLISSKKIRKKMNKALQGGQTELQL